MYNYTLLLNLRQIFYLDKANKNMPIFVRCKLNENIEFPLVPCLLINIIYFGGYVNHRTSKHLGCKAAWLVRIAEQKF